MRVSSAYWDLASPKMFSHDVLQLYFQAKKIKIHLIKSQSRKCLNVKNM